MRMMEVEVRAREVLGAETVAHNIEVEQKLVAHIILIQKVVAQVVARTVVAQKVVVPKVAMVVVPMVVMVVTPRKVGIISNLESHIQLQTCHK